MLLGHHDEQTDIFVLGLVLASLALGLDLHEADNLPLLVAQRERPCSTGPSTPPSAPSSRK